MHFSISQILAILLYYSLIEKRKIFYFKKVIFIFYYFTIRNFLLYLIIIYLKGGVGTRSGKPKRLILIIFSNLKFSLPIVIIVIPDYVVSPIINNHVYITNRNILSTEIVIDKNLAIFLKSKKKT